jgi:hypothetical protein
MCKSICATYIDIVLIRPIHRDDNGTISFEELKEVFNSSVAEDSIPFSFDWYV